jgi:hypothetical protein
MKNTLPVVPPWFDKLTMSGRNDAQDERELIDEIATSPFPKGKDSSQ